MTRVDSSPNSSAPESSPGAGAGSGVCDLESPPPKSLCAATFGVEGAFDDDTVPEATALARTPASKRDSIEASPRLFFSVRMRSSTCWLAAASLSKRTPIPGATPDRDGSCSRIQTTTPSPEMSDDVSWSWNSNLSCVPTASGSLVRMKIPPRLTSTE